MVLRELIQNIKPLKVCGDVLTEVTGIASDSRKVQKGFLFVAVKGTVVDGHDYIDIAIRNGACAIVCEEIPISPDASSVYVQVPDSADALGYLASEWYGCPSEHLTLVGVTGTNGKTTIATLLYKMFKLFGHKSGLLSTVCNYVDDEEIPSTHTTPDPIELNGLLSKMVTSGCVYAFMEVSSHSIAQKRISGLRFKGGIFTNLTRDHLDYHKTFGAYLKAKKQFFDYLPKTAFALSNADDKNGTVMLQNCKAKNYYYSLRTLADFRARIIEMHFDGTLMQINGHELFTHFVGRFNAYNLLAVYGATRLLGCPEEETLIALSTLHPVAGRFQTLRSAKGVSAIVDYAHTPDALTNVLNAIHGVLEGKGKIITVVGAGGNRDKGKRPLMAKEAVSLSDRVIITSDNPRNEEPDAIIRDMLEGVTLSDMNRVLSISDRKQAIKTAVMLAEPGDVILVAGKGHEDYQEIKGVKYHFSDREVLEELFGLR
ncbi:MAG: UDP-N-acetylmuramoyl-L-alanyl-D-glutamate--2,6-diaminopimelate ligase [Bacteroidales bacterium]|nr:UDP-N-acetylmuramoyl-L-alanyl-D-glutamate--2,6-diaminopimelate ligase [Bacteroidales bacterium]